MSSWVGSRPRRAAFQADHEPAVRGPRYLDRERSATQHAAPQVERELGTPEFEFFVSLDFFARVRDPAAPRAGEVPEVNSPRAVASRGSRERT